MKLRIDDIADQFGPAMLWCVAVRGSACVRMFVTCSLTFQSGAMRLSVGTRMLVSWVAVSRLRMCSRSCVSAALRCLVAGLAPPDRDCSSAKFQMTAKLANLPRKKE